jgi:hypothetical protein
MLSELHSLNVKLCSKQYNTKFVLHLIVVTQLNSGWQHNYSTKTRQAGWANEQSMYYPGNTKGGSITVPLTSCLTGLESAV